MDYRMVVFAVIWRRVGGVTYVMTQTRNPDFHTPDRVYGGLQEAVAETVKPGENIFSALERGIREETGVSIPSTMLLNQLFIQSGVQSGVMGLIYCLKTLCFVNAELPNKALYGPVFLVEVGAEFAPIYNQGPLAEAVGYRFWGLEDLGLALQQRPEEFVAYHIPQLMAAIRHLSEHHGGEA